MDSDEIRSNEETAAALIGILLDVSGSMKESASSQADKRFGRQRSDERSWSHSIFQVVNQLVKYDVSSENQVFALGYGAERKPHVFDLLEVVRLISVSSQRTKMEMINDILDILEGNGAPYVSEWSSIDILASYVSEEEAKFFLIMFKKNSKDFTQRFVQECLPVMCRRRSSSVSAAVVERRNWVRRIPYFGQRLYEHIYSEAQTATRESIRKTVKQGLNLIKEIGKLKDDELPDTWFAIANGLSSGAVVDVHKASEILHACVDKENLYLSSLRTKLEMINEFFYILEGNGAPYVSEWSSIDIFASYVSEEEAKFFLIMFKKNSKDFTQRFVQECLPVMCRLGSSSVSAAVVERRNSVRRIPYFGQRLYEHIYSEAQTATRESIRKTIKQGLNLIKEIGDELPDIWFAIANGLSSGAIVDVHKASEILHGCVDMENLTDEKVEALLKTVEPYIYGLTPMIAALNEAKTLFSLERYKHHRKLLFVVSDGFPTDHNLPPDMSRLGLHIVSCYITDSPIAEPKRLYSSKCHDWDNKAKFMFDLSSSVTTQLLPRTIFVKRGWQIDIENNETKLFLQVNHPTIIDEVCDFARDVVCFEDTLSDLLSSIDLDLYINKVNDGFGAKQQVGGTCYANASATVIHLATKRIVGRYGGYPEFFPLRDELIAKYGADGANTVRVLKDVCPKYRLQCREVNANGALKAVAAKRPAIARFRLTDSEWDKFGKFYTENPAGTLSKKDVDISERPPGSETGGHAVVLTGFNSKGLILMNSWGSDWANNGFFSVENANVLDLKFVDVFWTLYDLLSSEKESYELEGPRIAQKLMSSLRGLQRAEYKCPLCKEQSLVREFRGKLVKATCPKCYGEFNTSSEDAHDLVLNMYLTSLSSSGC